MKDLKESLRLYVEHRIPPGGFLKAVLSNDLSEAVGRADNENQHRLSEIVIYIYNNIPGDSWGSEEKVANWLKNKE